MQGPILQEFLKFSAAMDQLRPDVDQRSIVKSLGAIITAFKGDKQSAKDVRRFAVMIQRLFKNTPVQSEDIERFAKTRPRFPTWAKSPRKIALAILSGVLEVTGKGEATTQMRNLVVTLAGAKASKKKRNALAALGIKPEEVDFVGEDIFQVLHRLKSGVESTGRAASNTALEQLFGSKRILAALNLTETLDKAEARRNAGLDQAGYETDIAKATSGPSVELRRAQEAKRRALDVSGASALPILKDRLKANLLEAGFSGHVVEQSLSRFEK